MKLKQAQEFSDVISGFSYNFSNKIYRKLLTLQKQDKIFTDGNEKVKAIKKSDNLASSLTPLAEILISHLEDQLHRRCGHTFEGFSEFMELAKEFLSTVK